MEWIVVIESVGCQTNRCGFSQATDDDFDWWRRYGESETDFTGMLCEEERSGRWSLLRRLSDIPGDCMLQCGAAWWLLTLQDPQRATLLAEPMVWWQSPFSGRFDFYRFLYAAEMIRFFFADRYMIAEASAPQHPGDKARLVSPFFEPQGDKQFCLEFYYHAYGSGMGSFK